MACSCGKTNMDSDTTIFAIPPEIIETNILTRLDGPALACTASTCTQLHTLSTKEHLWANICHSTWPSTNTPLVCHVISTFPHASRSFFRDSFPIAIAAAQSTHHADPDRTPELISAVDLFHRRQLIFSKVVQTDTKSGWFRGPRFGVHMVHPLDTVQTGMEYPRGEEACRDLGEELTLSWIVIDPRGRRAVNVSSQKAVSVQRQGEGVSGKLEVRFATVMSGGKRESASEMALCSCMVEFGGEMELRQVSLQVEDMDGFRVDWLESLGILQRALEGERGRLRNEGRNGYGYEEFVNRKVERQKKTWKGQTDWICSPSISRR